jgi:formate/nitrite transporter
MAGGLTIAISGALNESISGSIPVYNGIHIVKTSGVAETEAASAGMKKLISGALFPIGLMLIVFSGAELFTGNIMYMLSARFGGQTTWANLLKNWIVSYFGNLCGALLVAYFLFFETNLFGTPNYKTYMNAVAHSKVYHGDFGTYFLKGVGCNYLVCLALWMACACEDPISKICAILWPIMTFICIGFEHSIANMFFIPLAIMYGGPITTNDFIVKNLIPVTLGNMLGATIFISIQYLIYHPYIGTAVANMELKQGDKKFVGGNSGKHAVPGHEDTIWASLSHYFNYQSIPTAMDKKNDNATPHHPPNRTDIEMQSV